MLTGTLKNTVNNYTFPLQGHDAQYQLIDVTGIEPVPATVNMATVAGMDGGRLNSAQLNTRNIVIYLRLNDADAVRKTLEDNFATKSAVELTLTTGSITAKIAGVVDTFECSVFSQTEIAQISIICPDPYFQSTTTQTVTISPTGSTILTDSNIETGVFIRIKYVSATAGRETTIAVTNMVLQQTVTVKYEFSQDDTIEICTIKGRRSVTLIRGGVRTNLFGSLQQGSVFWGIRKARNFVMYTIDGSSAANSAFQITVEYTRQYAGM